MTEQPTSTGAAPRRLLGTTDLALVAAFAALIAVLAVIGGIPVGGAGVPITLQTLGVLLAGAVLGPLRGFLSVGLYLVLAAVGLPILSGHTGGLAPFVGVTAGYLLTFPIAALVVGLVVRLAARAGRVGPLAILVGGLLGTVVNHLGGVIGMQAYLGVDWATAFSYDAPYWLGDVVKALLVAVVAAEVHKAFPQLLTRRG
ncbi:biotin transporter BioY [Nocardioides sp. GY 10127]|nr:biotin transporter BioY [Nocardioides sp. GY 10127]